MNSLTYLFGNQQKNSKWAWSWGKIWDKLGPILKKVKKRPLSLGFFHILLREYLLKKKVVAVKPLEWNLWQLLLEMPNLKDVRAAFLPD